MLVYSINMPFGAPIDINTKLIEFTMAMSGSTFQNVIASPQIIVYQNSNMDQIMINPVQFIFQVQHQYLFQDILKDLEFVKKAADCFVPDGCLFTIQLSDIKQLLAGSSMEVTKNIISLELSEDHFNNVRGIGLRLLNKDEAASTYNEFKCEPYIRDTSFLYFESINNFVYTKDISFVKLSETLISEFESKRDLLYSKIVK